MPVKEALQPMLAELRRARPGGAAVSVAIDTDRRGAVPRVALLRRRAVASVLRPRAAGHRHPREAPPVASGHGDGQLRERQVVAGPRGRGPEPEGGLPQRRGSAMAHRQDAARQRPDREPRARAGEGALGPRARGHASPRTVGARPGRRGMPADARRERARDRRSVRGIVPLPARDGPGGSGQGGSGRPS